MSYTIINKAKYNKAGQLMLSGRSNNVRPSTYSMFVFATTVNDETEKLIQLFKYIKSGCIQFAGGYNIYKMLRDLGYSTGTVKYGHVYRFTMSEEGLPLIDWAYEVPRMDNVRILRGTCENKAVLWITPGKDLAWKDNHKTNWGRYLDLDDTIKYETIQIRPDIADLYAVEFGKDL